VIFFQDQGLNLTIDESGSRQIRDFDEESVQKFRLFKCNRILGQTNGIRKVRFYLSPLYTVRKEYNIFALFNDFMLLVSPIHQLEYKIFYR
jgi:hypothetical protein